MWTDNVLHYWKTALTTLSAPKHTGHWESKTPLEWKTCFLAVSKMNSPSHCALFEKMVQTWKKKKTVVDYSVFSSCQCLALSLTVFTPVIASCNTFLDISQGSAMYIGLRLCTSHYTIITLGRTPRYSFKQGFLSFSGKSVWNSVVYAFKYSHPNKQLTMKMWVSTR